MLVVMVVSMTMMVIVIMVVIIMLMIVTMIMPAAWPVDMGLGGFYLKRLSAAIREVLIGFGDKIIHACEYPKSSLF